MQAISYTKSLAQDLLLLVVPESQLHRFKFYMDSAVCEAMRHSSGLYRLAYEGNIDGTFPASLGCELLVKGSPVVVSITPHYYRVWTSLRSPSSCNVTNIRETQSPTDRYSPPKGALLNTRLPDPSPIQDTFPNGTSSESLPRTHITLVPTNGLSIETERAKLQESQVVKRISPVLPTSEEETSPILSPDTPASSCSTDVPVNALPVIEKLQAVVDQSLSTNVEQETSSKNLCKHHTIRIFRPTTRIFSAVNAPDLLYWVTTSLEVGARYLLIDFSRVVFMDRLGIESLAIALRRSQKSNVQIALCSLGGQARMLFEMRQMEPLFPIYSSRQEFEQAIASGQVPTLS